MVRDIEAYERLRDRGHTADDVYRRMRKDGLKTLTALGFLRRVFHLSLADAKEVMVVADERSPSLTQYQGSLVSVLSKALG